MEIFTVFQRSMMIFAEVNADTLVFLGPIQAGEI
jgi:hypothetical protein